MFGGVRAGGVRGEQRRVRVRGVLPPLFDERALAPRDQLRLGRDLVGGDNPRLGVDMRRSCERGQLSFPGRRASDDPRDDERRPGTNHRRDRVADGR